MALFSVGAAALAAGALREGGRLLSPQPRAGPHLQQPAAVRGAERCGRAAFRVPGPRTAFYRSGGQAVLEWQAAAAGAGLVSVSIRDLAAGVEHALLSQVDASAGSAAVRLPDNLSCSHCELSWRLQGAGGDWWSCADVEIAAMDRLEPGRRVPVHLAGAGSAARHVLSWGGAEQLLVSLTPLPGCDATHSLFLSGVSSVGGAPPRAPLWEGHGGGALAAAVTRSSESPDPLYVTVMRQGDAECAAGAELHAALTPAAELRHRPTQAPTRWPRLAALFGAARALLRADAPASDAPGAAATRSVTARCPEEGCCCLDWADDGEGGEWEVREGADCGGECAVLANGAASPRGAPPQRRSHCFPRGAGVASAAVRQVRAGPSGDAVITHARAPLPKGSGRAARALQRGMSIAVVASGPPVQAEIDSPVMYHCDVVPQPSQGIAWVQWQLAAGDDVVVHTSRLLPFAPCPDHDDLRNSSHSAHHQRRNGSAIGAAFPSMHDSAPRALPSGRYCILVDPSGKSVHITLWAVQGSRHEPMVGGRGMNAHPGVMYAGHNAQTGHSLISFWGATGLYEPFRYRVYAWRGAGVRDGAAQMRDAGFLSANAALVHEEDGAMMPWRKRHLLRIQTAAFPGSGAAGEALQGPLWIQVVAEDSKGQMGTYAPLYHSLCMAGECTMPSQGSPLGVVLAVFAVVAVLVAAGLAGAMWWRRRYRAPPAAAQSPAAAADPRPAQLAPHLLGPGAARSGQSLQPVSEAARYASGTAHSDAPLAPERDGTDAGASEQDLLSATPSARTPPADGAAAAADRSPMPAVAGLMQPTVLLLRPQ